MIRIVFTITWFVITSSAAFSQSLKATELSMNKNFLYAKVAWVKDNRYCIILDKEYNSNNFPHFIFVFDSTGKPAYPSVKVKNAVSSQNEYCFTLGTTIFFLDGREDDMNHYVFKITNMITADCIDHEMRKNIFSIGMSKEGKKLNSKTYTFKVHKGIHSEKAILSYNNDYLDPYKEGFRFRVLEQSGELSNEDTLTLPYLDRECNIEEAIYDDKTEKIYLLCDYFLSTAANEERTFKNSFVAIYDIKLKSFRLVSDSVPAFFNSKIQYLIKDSTATFTGLRINGTDSTGWAVAFLVLKQETAEVLHSAVHDIKPELAGGFIGFSRKLNRQFILPINFIEDKDGSLIAGWTKFFTLTQMAENRMSDEGAVMAAGVMFGLIGAGIASVATANNSWLQSKDINRALWFHYFPETNSFKETAVSSTLRTKKYFAHSYMSLQVKDTTVWMMNKPTEEQGSCSKIFAEGFNNSNTDDSVFYKIFSDLKINLIYPQSLYTHNGINYFIGEYDVDNCIDPKKDTERKIYLVEMK
jgi:hypothetical protein